MDAVTPAIELKITRSAESIFPWLRYLKPEHKVQFYTDLFIALGQALREKNWRRVEEVLESWEATAEVLADPELTAWLSEPVENGEWEDWDDVEAEIFYHKPVFSKKTGL